MKVKFNIKKLFLLLLSAACIVACLEEYVPPIVENDENILVVEGNIGDTKTSVRLSRTTNLGVNALIPEINARVILEDESQSIQYDLSEKEFGLYEDSITIELDRKYRIRILTGNDQEFVSDALDVIRTPEIDSVGWDATSDGLQIHISTHDDNNNTRYYLWSYEETYFYRSRYASYYIYENEDMRGRTNEEQINGCWKTNNSTNIIAGSTIQLAQDLVYKFPIHFIIPSENVKLARKYSIKVTQRAISKEYFEFWDLLKQNSEDLGSFFDPQPSQLTSNINPVNNEDGKVLGFIGASTLKEERIFIDRLDLPYNNIPNFSIGFCVPDTILNNPDSLRDFFASGFNLPTLALTGFTGNITHYIGASKSCVDCRLEGGTTDRPLFWEN